VASLRASWLALTAAAFVFARVGCRRDKGAGEGGGSGVPTGTRTTTSTARARGMRGLYVCGLALLLGAAACAQILGIDDARPGWDGGTGGTTGTLSSASSGGGDAGELCTPGSMMACYDGPASTEGIGLCTGGMATCKPDGSGYGACTGEVTPQAPACAVPAMDTACTGHDCVQWAELVGDIKGSPASAVAVDAAGNSYVIGNFAGVLQLAGVTLTAMGTDDVFLLKLDPNGVPIWGRSYGAQGGTTNGLAVAVDASANVAIGGSASASVQFGGYAAGPGTFVAKLDTSGTVQWAESLTVNPKAPYSDGIYGVAFTSAGDVVTGGQFSSSIQLGDNVVPGATALRGFVASLNGSNGSGKSSDGGWGTALCVGTKDCTVVGVAIAAQDDVIVAGNMQGDLTIDPGVPPLEARGLNDIFLVELTSSGALFWQDQIGGAGAYTLLSALASANGSPTVAGTLNGTAQLTPTDMVTSGDSGLGSGLVVHYDAGGGYLWSATLNASPPFALGADATGNLFLAGAFTGTLDLGAPSGSLTSMGSDNLFVAKLSSAQTPVWSRQYGDAMTLPSPAGVAVTPQGDPIIVGGVQGAIDFGTGPLTPAGQEDAFVVKLSQ
jgi:hypothetical protein